ncbi:hypothetical protein QWY82_00810 [Simiduia curdlanivorans]|uniref:PepSY domain-containing protein n=1 Tax=Simiduia curdlanivorans TaxID=1492769 RepID=A0ABV8V279_9GAMM|nr:hypothetical protein [Simiduia curdlanivorans]MDN3637334.1 hypothetical protein [Simiduia curdlanivorans]
MKLKRAAWQLHKYLSYFIFAQIFVWVLGGVVFATVPFTELVKGGDYVRQPAAVPMPAHWSHLVAGVEGVQSATAVASAQGPLIKLELARGQRWLNHQGVEVGKVDALAVAAFAGELYLGSGELREVRWLDTSEPRLLGLVDELYGQTGVWQAVFDDARLYLNDRGEYLKVRTNYWVWYDALWRLHIMDYGDGDNFNNILLRLFAWLAFCFVLTGLVLSFYAFRRTLNRRVRTHT